jgi:hypothetical protein
MSLNRGKLENTEGVREAEFVVLDFIRSTPNATIPEIARLIDDVGADLNYLAGELGIDPVILKQAYDDSIVNAPPIQQVIEKQITSQPIVPPQAPLTDVITVDPPSSPDEPPPDGTITVDPGASNATDVPRNTLTGGPAGSPLPVGLGASERAILDAEEKARQDLLTTYGISRQDLQRGTTGASRALSGGINEARGDIRGGFGRAESMFTPYGQAGQQALQQQLALSGALGGEAFQQAYRESPQMKFLREQGERGILRTAAARGGLGGGNVMKEIAKYGTGLASQDLQNQISNLQALSGQGLTATGQSAGYAAGGAQQLAQLAQQLGVREADLQQTLGAAQANIALGLGTRASDLSQTMGTNIAGMRTRAGEQAARMFGEVSQGLSGLQREQGSRTQDLIAGQTDYINTLTQAAAAGNAQAQTELARMQANINMGIGSNLAGVAPAQFTPLPNMAGSIIEGAALGIDLAEAYGAKPTGGAPVSTSQPAYLAPSQINMSALPGGTYQNYGFNNPLSNLGG